jgi:2,4-dienoyl-CoA reductase (NADPH2)
MRLNAFEYGRDGGATLDETLVLAPQLVAAGLDALHVSAYASNDIGIGVTESHTPHEPGKLVAMAAAVKQVVDVPIITFGRLEPDAADAVLARGDADFVAMGRKLLADPALPNKLAAGRTDDIRPCIYQYRCIGNIFVRGSVACVANPETSRERELAVTPAAAPGRHLVVGGGPAGLEAARRLAEAGHTVELWERSTTLGGRLALGARADETLDRFLGWLVHAAERAGVTFRLGRDVTAADAQGFDAVVVATGATWSVPDDLVGGALPQVHALDALAPWLAGDTPIGSDVVFLGGGKIAVTLAMHARAQGSRVTIVEPSGVFVPELGLPGRFRLVHDVEAAGARLVTGAWSAITRDGVDVVVGDETELVPADAVIVAHGAQAGAPLADALRSSGVAVRVIGDCREVRRIEGAMLDAAELTAPGTRS